MERFAPIELFGFSMIVASGLTLLWESRKVGDSTRPTLVRWKLKRGYMLWGSGALLLAVAVTVGQVSFAWKLVMLAASLALHLGGLWNLYSARKLS